MDLWFIHINEITHSFTCYFIFYERFAEHLLCKRQSSNVLEKGVTKDP